MGEFTRFDGQVVLITGAARGLGRAYANILEARGATVILNDLDLDDGIGTASDTPARPEIAGAETSFIVSGSAIDGGDLVRRALNKAGRIDAMILNAGFLRDRSFAKSTEEDFRDLLDVHLLGPWRAAKAAWPAMVVRGGGRIVFTTSPAGLYGGFGQSAYSAAKAALVGLTRTLAIEGQKHGIMVNCVAPLASSRLSEGAIPPHIAERLPPASVAGLVAYLCHPSCKVSGQVYETAGGSIARHLPHRTEGVHLGREPSLETVREAWDAINSVEPGEDPTSSADAMLRFIRRWPDAADLGVTS